MQKRITQLRAESNGSALTVTVKTTDKTKKHKFSFTNLRKDATKRHAKIVNDILTGVFHYAGYHVQDVKITK